MTNEAASRLVFKILSAREWQQACEVGTYNGSADDVRDGFIHLSAAHQVAGTAAKYFRDQPGLLLVAFDSAGLGPTLKWEPSRGGDIFPHLYSPLPTARALWTKPLPLGVMTNACFQHDDGMPGLPEHPKC